MVQKTTKTAGSYPIRAMRSAFTLIELIFVIAVLAILYFYASGKIFGGFERTEIQSGITNDVDVLSTGIFDFKLQSPYSNPTGTYGGIGAEYVSRAMTDKMAFKDADGTVGNNQYTADYIESIGMNGNCHYFVAPDRPSGVGTSTNQAFKVYMDCSQAIVNKGWSAKEATRAEDVFIKGFTQRSLVPPKVYLKATAIGTANGSPTLGGTLTDGKVCVAGNVN